MIRKVSVLATAIALLVAVHFSQARIDTLPEKKEMVAANPFHKLPPAQYLTEYVGSMLLGGMRAVAIDYLWIQYTRAERARQYREVEAILEVLVRLQPEFPEVWNHLAWARAYNIAAQMEKPEDRWKWVEQGLQCADQGVARSPQSDKLMFHKGYLLYHRLPQEPYLLERYFKATGRPAAQDASLAFERAIELAQSKGRDNTIPPCDAMMQESFQRWAFDEMTRGNWQAAEDVLHRGKETYERLMKGRGVTEVNTRSNAVFEELVPIFRIERQWAEKPGGEVFEKLVSAYSALERRRYAIHSVEKRLIILLLPRVVPPALALAREGRFKEASELIDTRFVDFAAALSVRDDGSVNPFWQTYVSLGQRLRAAIGSEEDGKKVDAAKKYEDLCEEFRYTVPDATVDALRDRAKELKGR